MWVRFNFVAFSVLLFPMVIPLMGWATSSTVPRNPFRGGTTDAKAKEFSRGTPLRIYFSGNVHGTRDLCGCSINPKGGVDRRLNYIKSRASDLKNGLVLDFGNVLFKHNPIEERKRAEAIANAAKMVDALNFFPYQAINFGALDRAFELRELMPLLSKTKSAWISTNVIPTSRIAVPLKKKMPIKLEHYELVIFGLSSGVDQKPGAQWKFDDPAEALNQQLRDLPTGSLPIVLSDLEGAELTAVAGSVKRPTIFLGSRESASADRPIEVGSALLAHIRHQGQEWGELTLNWSDRKTGWYDPHTAPALAARWDDLAEQEKALRAVASSDDKKAELSRIEQQLKDLAVHAPDDRDNAYKFETAEMSEAYDGKNEVTGLVK